GSPWPRWPPPSRTTRPGSPRAGRWSRCRRTRSVPVGDLDADTLDPDSLSASAIEQAGLSDLGPESFREGLELYTESVRAEAQLSELGELSIEAPVVAPLVNRLKVVDSRHHHPEVADEPIDAPIVVVGM